MTRRPIDVLWLVEHVAREMDVACAAAALLRRRHGVSVQVRNMYQHADAVLRGVQPRVVVHPFFYAAQGALATEDFVRAWPQAVHFNLAWEQIHYAAHMRIKSPSDAYSRDRVRHHAWGEFHRRYLTGHGVPDTGVFVNGHPAYQLYRDPYRQFFPGREELARAHGLDPSKRWVFLADNYRWAFLGGKIKLFARQGGDVDEMKRMQEFSTRSLRTVLGWCREASRDSRLEVIFRPRPAIHTRQIADFIQEHLGAPEPRMRIIKAGSVREWVLASDLVVSSYSTSLIEASIAGKPVRMAEPIPFPESLWCDWYRHVPRLRDGAGFLQACLEAGPGDDGGALRRWAESEMLANGDPIESLVREVASLARATARTPGPGVAATMVKALARLLPAALKRPKEYFNRQTHENDAFSPEESEQRIQAWDAFLNAQARRPQAEPLSTP